MIQSGKAPATYLDQPVPPEIAANWRRWQAAHWRRMAHLATSRSYPPDLRGTVSPPTGMCPVHLQSWHEHRDNHFNPITGDRWPGDPGSFLDPKGSITVLRNERRVEWDEKASEQMQLIERICLSGRSPQCNRPTRTPPARLPAEQASLFDLAGTVTP